MQKIDNALRLVFPSEMIFENVRTDLEFNDKHDIQIDSQKVITKHEWGIWTIDILERDTNIE